jgi:hypothetical protein
MPEARTSAKQTIAIFLFVASAPPRNAPTLAPAFSAVALLFCFLRPPFAIAHSSPPDFAVFIEVDFGLH